MNKFLEKIALSSVDVHLSEIRKANELMKQKQQEQEKVLGDVDKTLRNLTRSIGSPKSPKAPGTRTGKAGPKQKEKHKNNVDQMKTTHKMKLDSFKTLFKLKQEAKDKAKK